MNMANAGNGTRVRKNDQSMGIPGLAPVERYSSRLSARSALYTELRLLLDGREHALAREETTIALSSSRKTAWLVDPSSRDRSSGRS